MYRPAGINKERATLFSDAIVAIAMTVMVLQLRHPAGHDWASLSNVWPTLGAYALSFLSVGTYWVNHHHVRTHYWPTALGGRSHGWVGVSRLWKPRGLCSTTPTYCPSVSVAASTRCFGSV
jgi:Endosomal/lysosomal potassium channel TMEM175